MFDRYIHLWNLIPDGEAIYTPSSGLLPVCYNHSPAMLKVALCVEEKRGNRLMARWNGRGAAQVFASDGDAILLERASSTLSLADECCRANDRLACRIICSVVEQLHQINGKDFPELIPISRWFVELEPSAKIYSQVCGYSVLRHSVYALHQLLENPQQPVVLHGDIHHDNILHFDERGWLAIDPKGLTGERGFDYANLFCNPLIASTDLISQLFHQRVHIVTEYSGLERKRLLMWILAWCGLSAVWLLHDKQEPLRQITIAEMAAGELGW